MSFSDILDTYAKEVSEWLDQSKKVVAAVQRLQKAVANGNVRDLEKLRANARSAQESAQGRAETIAPLTFDAAAYLTPEGAFIPELQAAAERAGVKLSVRDGLIFCYPVLLHLAPELSAVRIEKRLEPNIRPEVLAAQLKKIQSREPKSRPDRFIEALFDAYELVRAKRSLDAYIDIPLTQIYQVLTLLPGADKEYTILDFTRDIYFLDLSGLNVTKKGFHMALTASTVSRERSAKILKFVTRDGYEKEFAAIKFSAGAA
ncbi:MAG TPA: hypothetical protein VGL77_10680 [Armatimonadota bacterium]|jgi:hypothetical protein